MAPKTKAAENSIAISDQNKMFAGMVVFLIGKGVQARRLQTRKQKLVQMVAAIEERLSKRVTRILAMDTDTFLQQFDSDRLTRFKGSSLPYCPLDQNKNITEIFGKLVIRYRALGGDRRSFSYHKAIAVIGKLPYKIEGVDRIKNLPAIGKSMKDHVRTISLFGEVWGIGPATALKLYEKGHCTLDDLRNEESLTHAQKVGEMEHILQKVGEDILAGVNNPSF